MIKAFARWLLALVLVMCSVWQVWEQLTKFLEGSTTTSLEKVNRAYLPMPMIVMCSSQRYKYDALTEMGLPKNFLDDHRLKDLPVQFPDLNQTWLKATWSLDDFNLFWLAYEGKYSKYVGMRTYIFVVFKVLKAQLQLQG